MKSSVITVGTRSVVKKGGSLMITIPAEATKWMKLVAGDQVFMKYDPFKKHMIVEKLTVPSREEEEEILRILQETGAYFPETTRAREHYKLASGKHSDHYVFVRLTSSYKDRRLRIAHLTAKHFEDDDIDVVAAFTVGGALLGNQVSRLLDAKMVIGRKTEDDVEFYNLFKIDKGDNILFIDDVLTTGGSIKKAMDVIRRLKKGTIRGVAIVVDRSEGGVARVIDKINENTELDVKAIGLVSLDLSQYEPKNCPLCPQCGPPVDLSRIESNKHRALSVLTGHNRDIMAIGFEEYEQMLQAARQEAEKVH